MNKAMVKERKKEVVCLGYNIHKKTQTNSYNKHYVLYIFRWTEASYKEYLMFAVEL